MTPCLGSENGNPASVVTEMAKKVDEMQARANASNWAALYRFWTAPHTTQLTKSVRGLCRPGASPTVHGSHEPFWIRHSYMYMSMCMYLLTCTCSSCSHWLVYSLLSLSRSLAACSPPPTASSSSSPVFLACRTPGGSRAMPSPYQSRDLCMPRRPKPGDPSKVIFACTRRIR